MTTRSIHKPPVPQESKNNKTIGPCKFVQVIRPRGIKKLDFYSWEHRVSKMSSGMEGATSATNSALWQQGKAHLFRDESRALDKKKKDLPEI